MPTPKTTASCQPKLGPGKSTEPLTRCRVAVVCYGDAPRDQLRLRRVRLPGGAVAPTLCCEACAEHANQPAEVAGGPQ